jgi:hypothetical protein
MGTTRTLLCASAAALAVSCVVHTTPGSTTATASGEVRVSRGVPVAADGAWVNPPPERKVERQNPPWWKGTVTVDNQTKWTIHHLFVTEYDQTNWGPDQLTAPDTLDPGEKMEIGGLDCYSYDIKLVDKDGDTCVLNDVGVCNENVPIAITTEDFARCQGWD